MSARRACNLRRRVKLAIILLAVTCLTPSCNGNSTTEESPFAPHWALTTADVGGELYRQAGRGASVDGFGQGACLVDVTGALALRFRLGAPTETTKLTVGQFDVRSQVTQLKGKPDFGSTMPLVPDATTRLLFGTISGCEYRHKQGASDRRVETFEMFGRDVDLKPATGISTFGWKSKLVPPWDKSLRQDGDTSALQKRVNATEWYEEAWYTVTSEQTLIILAIQGPSDPTKEFDYPALIDTMVKRVQADPPAQSWAEPEDLGW